ncbi:MAG: hypothetical protein IKW08_04175 [Roseburia sp.]|nr:hypothetical protein [Roseburia sp.]
MEIKENIYAVEEAMKETINIVQLFRDVAEKGEEDTYIIRSISTIEKMLHSICDNEIAELKKNI